VAALGTAKLIRFPQRFGLRLFSPPRAGRLLSIVLFCFFTPAEIPLLLSSLPMKTPPWFLPRFFRGTGTFLSLNCHDDTFLWMFHTRKFLPHFLRPPRAPRTSMSLFVLSCLIAFSRRPQEWLFGVVPRGSFLNGPPLFFPSAAFRTWIVFVITGVKLLWRTLCPRALFDFPVYPPSLLFYRIFLSIPFFSTARQVPFFPRGLFFDSVFSRYQPLRIPQFELFPPDALFSPLLPLDLPGSFPWQE